MRAAAASFRALAAFALATLAGSGCGARDGGPPVASEPVAAAESAPVTPARAAKTDAERAVELYWEAHRAIVAEQDFDSALAQLEKAVALDADFGEAWFQLGTARLAAAASARGVDDAEALRWFRTGVGQCRLALDLMNRGALRVWDVFELAEAREELESELATIGPDAGLASDSGARAALDRWAVQKGFEPEAEAETGADPGGAAPDEGEDGARSEA